MTEIWVGAVIVGVVLIGWLIQELINAPAEREFERQVKERLEGQARKRGGSVGTFGRRAELTVPYKGLSIEVSTAGSDSDDGGSTEHTYARFQTDVFNDKEFKFFLDSKNLLLKPLVFGARVEVPDEEFRRFGTNF
jgi:hypothetical protein